MEKMARLNLSSCGDVTKLKSTLLSENFGTLPNHHTPESTCFNDLNKFTCENSNTGINQSNAYLTKSNESMDTLTPLTNERKNRKIANATRPRRSKMTKRRNNISSDIISDDAGRQRLDSMRLEEERMHKEIETEAEFSRSEEGRKLAKQRKLEEEKREEKRRLMQQAEEEKREKERIEKTLSERMWLETIHWKCTLDSPTAAASGGNFHNFL